MTQQVSFKRFRLWFTWNLRKEEEWMTAMSATGQHLAKPGLFRQTFAQDASVRYVYRLDYQQNYRDREEFAGYVQLYADSGWEYVGTLSGVWHYFRMPSRGTELPELYTDRSSLREFYLRIQKTMGLFVLINLALCLLNARNWVHWSLNKHVGAIAAPAFVIYLFLIGLLVFGFFKVRRIVKSLSAD